MTEKELIKGCSKNDRRCQNALYKKYFPLMSSIAQRYCKEHEVIDLMNRGFLKVLQNIEKYDPGFSLATWIRTILIRTIIDHYRSEKNELTLVQMSDMDDQNSGSHSYNDAVADLDKEDLLQLLRQLPPMSKKVFNLYAIDGFGHKEIAEMLGIKEGTSKWHLSEARKKLRKAVEELATSEKKMEVLRNEA